MVESMEMSAHLATAGSGVSAWTTRSMMGLPYFEFADLEVARVRRGFDVVAGGVHLEQARRLTAYLPADDERGD
jgi:hypothetical protein